ncbi:MAG: YggT family protein [Paracoccaceae bacterium]
MKGRDLMGSIAMILLMILNLAWWVVIIHIVMSWLINFDVINTRQAFVANVWRMLERLVEPVYRPIRNALPSLGGLDLAPLLVLLGIAALRIVIANNMMAY